VSIRDQLVEQEARRFLSGLQAIDILLDEAIARESEKQSLKVEQRQQVRAELDAAMVYDQAQKMRHIQRTQHTPV
jgi:hypothetical protein